MKNTLTLCCALISIFSGISFAQTQTNLSELLDRLNENHSGSIAQVFTPEEILVLREHFDGISPSVIQTNPENVGVVFYSPENVNMNIGGYLHENPGTFNVYGPSGTADFDGAGAYNPLTDMYFAVDNAGNAYDVNPTTYSYTLKGTVSAPPGESYVGLEFDPTSNLLYGLSTDGAGNTGLSTIDPVSLSVSYKGNTGLTLGIALGFDLSGDAYAIDIDTDESYKIDKNTANATLLGSIGFDANFGQGMGLSRSLNQIYISAFNNTTFNSELRTLDKMTGFTESWGPIGNMSPGGTLQFAWTSAREIDLGIRDHDFANLQYYPNPVQDMIFLRADTEIDSISIVNMLGQTVYQSPVNSVRAETNLNELAAGYYILNVSINERSKSYKLVKY